MHSFGDRYVIRNKTETCFDDVFTGLQSIYEDVARDTNRGHTVQAVCETFKYAKDAGFKVVAHMMPDLPNVDLERDLEQFRVILIEQNDLFSFY